MKWKKLVILAIITTVAMGCTREVSSNQVDTQTSTTATRPSAKAGNFQAGEHPTQGKLTVVTEQGKQYLEFDQDFKTDKGPDLFVILHTSDAPPVSGIKEKDYVTLAPLQKISGNQRYALPNNIKLANYKSVAIWCRKFNATFGYATL
ncbi:DM13 domain-containing protein [Anabaena sp. UHCC 0399]|uniref:DM13 domain-containing protein n=1 Tax=Anabaena sp. UHCC 0399 TaxID=3110238 RepID=UPI002B1F904C|nr:DM13 domain-containing protein [Anabaena sp. UHCC 0399]MEA5564445.1 DM13 domain-containing protein [Anabaena sp. UHCC 0399]